MNTKDKTPQELARGLLASTMLGITVELGNEDLMSFDDAHPGALDVALTELVEGEPRKAVTHLRHAVKLCSEPVADGRGQAQRTRLLGATAGALALLEQTDYRGPDRRAGADVRSGEDRRHAGTSPPPEVLEQRCGEDRRGGTDRRSPASAAMWEALQRGEDAQYVLAYKLAPLLAVCEAVTKATHALQKFAGVASYDKVLLDRLSSIEPEWQDAISDAAAPQHIGQCLLLARDLCGQAVGTLDTLVEGSVEAMDRLKRAA